MKRILLVLAALMLVGAKSAFAEVTYYHNDLAGSPVAATNSSGQVIWRESYRPYGERLTNSAASTGNHIWFTSRRQDTETGLVYMGARYYDPVVGRFVSTDPVQFDETNVQSFNRYAYANNNPYRYFDPDGRTTAPLYVIGGLAIGTLGFAMLPEDKRRELAQSAINGLRGLYGIFSESAEGDTKSSATSSNAPVPDARPGRETKGRTKQWEKPGGMDEADQDFDNLKPENVRELPNGGRTGTLPGGRTVIVRPDSSDGRPTLEIQDGKIRDKVRYGE